MGRHFGITTDTQEDANVLQDQVAYRFAKNHLFNRVNESENAICIEEILKPRPVLVRKISCRLNTVQIYSVSKRKWYSKRLLFVKKKVWTFCSLFIRDEHIAIGALA